MFDKEETPLKHANQFLYSSWKCCVPLANIGFNDLKKLVILITVTNHVLEHRKNWRWFAPMICKYYWKSLQMQEEHAKLEVDQRTLSRLYEIGKIEKLGKYHKYEFFENGIASCFNICILLLINIRRIFYGKLLLVTKNGLCTTILKSHIHV